VRLTRFGHPKLGEVLLRGRHETGLEVIVNPKPGFARRIAALTVCLGSVDRSYRFVEGESGVETLPEGSAHFLEHELFGKESGDISLRFAEAGAAVNAATGLTSTTFSFCASNPIEEPLALLFELVHLPCFRDEHVARERAIIRQEMRMYADDPDWCAYRALLEALYHRHPIRGDIAGTEESLEQIDASVLDRAHRAFYHPSNMVLVVSGDVDAHALTDRVEAILGGLELEPVSPVRRIVPEEPDEPAHRARTLRLDVREPRLLFGIKDATATLDERARLVREIRWNLLLALLFGSGSALPLRLYEQGLVDDSFGASYLCEGGVGFAVVGGITCDPARLNEILAQCLEAARRRGIDRLDFERTRRKALGRFLFGFNSPEGAARVLLGCWAKGTEPAAYRDAVASTRAEDLEDLLDELSTATASATTRVLPLEGVAGG